MTTLAKMTIKFVKYYDKKMSFYKDFQVDNYEKERAAATHALLCLMSEISNEVQKLKSTKKDKKRK